MTNVVPHKKRKHLKGAKLAVVSAITCSFPNYKSPEVDDIAGLDIVIGGKKKRDGFVVTYSIYGRYCKIRRAADGDLQSHRSGNQYFLLGSEQRQKTAKSKILKKNCNTPKTDDCFCNLLYIQVQVLCFFK
jgi:hypothetical protein